ncbi:MAG: M20 family metallopeptidase [Candidatus Thorarchaeota archaeon]
MRNEKRVLSLAKKLIAANSENPPGREREVAEVLLSHFEPYGIHRTQVGSDDRPNLVFSTHDGEMGSLVLHGHMDTVPAGPREKWEHDPFGCEVVDGRLYGRGAADMKGPLAALAEAMILYKKANHKEPLLLLATSNEENGLLGAEEVANSGIMRGVKYGVCAEPTSLQLFLGVKGVVWVKVTATGKTGHSSRPDTGNNAIDLCIQAIHVLTHGDYPCEPDALLGEYTMNVGKIEGGTQQGVIPESCEALIDMRIVKGQTPESIMDLMRRHLDDAGIGQYISIENYNSSYTTITPFDSKIVKFATRAIEDLTGSQPTLGVATYGSDASVLQNRIGISNIIYGPGSIAQAHQPNEYIEIDELLKSIDVYLHIARAFIEQ